VPATGADDMESSAPMRSAPASEAVGATSAPARGAPSEAVDESPPAPAAPAPPTDLLERASTPPARRTDRRAVLPSTTVGPETDVASVGPTPAVGDVAVTRP